MVYNLKPFELSFDFEDRDYALGNTIDVRVTLTPKGEAEVREARIDLVCEERYSQRGTSFVPDTYAQASRAGSVVSGRTRHVGTERKDRVVHSTVSFLGATRLTGTRPSVHSARLLVQPTPPPHFEEARALQRDAQSSWSFKWTLVVTIDVVRGRNPKRQRAVKVKLPMAEVGTPTGAKPRMSTPKRRTGPAGVR